MTKLQKELIERSIPFYCKGKGISQMELAVKAGVGYTDVIRKMVNGTAHAVPDKVWRKVWNIINPDSLEGIYQTEDCRKVFNVCEAARKNRYMIGLTGDTGMGKSTACKAYSVRPNVWYYYIDGTVSPLTFLRGLLQEMGVPFEGSAHDMLNRVADELNTQENPLLIVDESGKMNARMILCLHSLRDKTMKNCGIVLAGMPAFRNALIAHVNKGTNGYGEFFRRINLWDELTGLTPVEIVQILEGNGITDKEAQKEYRKLNRFGDLMNQITLHKTMHESGI